MTKNNLLAHVGISLGNGKIAHLWDASSFGCPDYVQITTIEDLVVRMEEFVDVRVSIADPPW